MGTVNPQRAPVVALLLALALWSGPAAAPSRANPASEALRRQGWALAYNLDHDQAMATFRKAVEADPEDSAAYRAVAVAAWLHLLFQRGSILVDDYLGSITKPNVKFKEPPRAMVELFRTNIDKALALGERREQARPDDPGGHYDVGAAVGQMAAFAATAEGRVIGGIGAARRAFNEHERVLELDPSRKDAGLIVGTYRYVVANMSLPLRWFAYLAGFGGGRDRGIQMIEEAAAYASDVQTEARFALVLIYNRERRYDDALRVLKDLRDRFPRNRLLWLESGATSLRGSRWSDALAALDHGIEMCDRDPRERAFGEAAIWRYKRGLALAALGRRDEARADFNAALRSQGRDWVLGRVHTELGKLADLVGDRATAVAEYRQAVTLARADSDDRGADEASNLLDRPYRRGDAR